MSVQVYPYTKNKNIWYCPSDKLFTPSPQFIAQGKMSYQWFPNWVYNVWGPGSTAGASGPFPCVRYPDGFKSLWDDPPSLRVDRPAERTLFSERGMFGWQGPDANSGTAPNSDRNHPMGYNILYFDGHVKTIPYGKKWTTVPATGWPPDRAPT
jgi:prepilin-type processing-associated H-X9-DG protein